MDVDGSGRFNELDVSALTALLGNTDQASLRWDFDNSGVIDSADVDFLQSLIACGLGSGVFGDADGDGDADCDDLAIADAAVGQCVGDPGYIIALDNNLDGCVDASDRAAWIHLINPADFNTDGSVNSQDFFDFLACWTTSCPKADFNNDGLVNSQDFNDFLAAFFSPAC